MWIKGSDFADLPYFYFWRCLIYVLYIYVIESISMWMLYLMADHFIVRNTLLNQHKCLFLKTHFIFKICVRPCHWNDTSFLAIPNFYFACQSTLLWTSTWLNSFALLNYILSDSRFLILLNISSVAPWMWVSSILVL